MTTTTYTPATLAAALEAGAIDATAYIVVDDGQYRYPLALAALPYATAREARADIDARGADTGYSDWCQQYRLPAWCQQVAVGTQHMIDLCETLTDAGADTWPLASR